VLGRWSELFVIKLDLREIEQCGGIHEVRALPWHLQTRLLEGCVAVYCVSVKFTLAAEAADASPGMGANGSPARTL
jgi:hypothetical protein